MTDPLLVNVFNADVADVAPYIRHGKDFRPEWFTSGDHASKRCSGIVDLFAQSLVLLAPTDMRIDVDGPDNVRIQTLRPTYALNNVDTHGTAASGDFLPITGLAHSIIQYNAIVLPHEDGRPRQSMLVPPIYFQKDLDRNPIYTPPGVTSYTYGYPMALIIILLFPSERGSIIFREGDPLAMHWFTEPFSRVEFSQFRGQVHETNRGDSAKYRRAQKLKCPFPHGAP